MKKGFTLIELLVVVAIIGILVALALPALSSASLTGKQATTAGNLRQVGVALLAYAYDHDQYFPAAHSAIRYTTADISTMPDDEVGWQQRLDYYIGFTGTSDQTTGTRRVFNAPSSAFKENGFFIGSHAAGYASQHDPDPDPVAGQGRYAALKLTRITAPMKHILGGEVTRADIFNVWDVDKDDYDLNDPAFGGNKDPKRVVKILFADGHVGSYAKFDPSSMTTRYEGVKDNGDGYSYDDN